MRINNNTAAFNVWTSYTQNSGNMKSAMSKLSTGVISNTDDPAGVGISERMRAQINGTAMARQNTENSISLVQTADAWLQKINDQLSRMKALAIESKGVVSGTDKANIQTEFKQMQNEITRITSKYTAAAKFNGLYLFRGGNGVAILTDTAGTPDGVQTGNLDVQIGADINQTVSIELKDLQVGNTAVIGSVHTYGYNSSHSVTGSTHAAVQWGSIIDVNKVSATSSSVIGRIDVAIDHVANVRANFGAQQVRLENTREGLLTYEDNLRSAESKIRDVDMARETTIFSKYQILTNASNAMLAQANQLPGSVLQLLG
jgi:flagellin